MMEFVFLVVGLVAGWTIGAVTSRDKLDYLELADRHPRMPRESLSDWVNRLNSYK